MKTKLVVIVGPTAVGKSDFAVKYALEHNGEVISADSRQVYKDLDIGTGKITKEEMQGVPHHLLDVEDPQNQFTVGKFKELAEKAITNITSRGKLPVICGGTGFYIDAVVNDVSYPDVVHNESLRNELKEKSSHELFDRLKNLDEDYAENLNNSERNNPQRLIRAIEIVTTLGKMPKIKSGNPKYDTEWIKIDALADVLKKRIHERLLKRIDAGMIEEVKKLYQKGLSWERMEELGLEYRYISRYLRGLISKEEMINQLETEIWHYAKRQILWFKRIP